MYIKYVLIGINNPQKLPGFTFPSAKTKQLCGFSTSRHGPQPREASTMCTNQDPDSLKTHADSNNSRRILSLVLVDAHWFSFVMTWTKGIKEVLPEISWTAATKVDPATKCLNCWTKQKNTHGERVDLQWTFMIVSFTELKITKAWVLVCLSLPCKKIGHKQVPSWAHLVIPTCIFSMTVTLNFGKWSANMEVTSCMFMMAPETFQRMEATIAKKDIKA